MTVAGPDGCRALVLQLSVTMADGSVHTLDTSDPALWEARTGPVVWDHFFHGETYDATLPLEWSRDGGGGGTNGDPNNTTAAEQAWGPAHVVAPQATAATGMQVVVGGEAVALGVIKPTQSPPLQVVATFPALAVTHVTATDVGAAHVFDFGQNMAGMVRLTLPAGHGIPKGTVLRIEHAEIVQGHNKDISAMCELCPQCSPCVQGGGGGGSSGPSGKGSCDSRGAGAACDTCVKKHCAPGSVAALLCPLFALLVSLT